MNITGGKFNNRKVPSPKNDLVRPTSSKIRASIFNMLQGMYNISQTVFLDLFAGSGIMGLEATSRGADSVVFVEKNKIIYNALKKTLQDFDGNFDSYNLDALRFLDIAKTQFDIIFLDPPYFEGFYEKVIAKIKKNSILKKNGILIVETPSALVLPDSLNIVKEKIYGTTKISFLTL